MAEKPLVVASAGKFHVLSPGTPSSSCVRTLSTPAQTLILPSPNGEEGTRGSLNEESLDAATAKAAAEAAVAAAQHQLQQRFEALRKELWATCQAAKSQLNHQLESVKIELLSSKASLTEALTKEAGERRRMETRIEALNESISEEVMARRAVNMHLEVQLGEQTAYLNEMQASVHKALTQCPKPDMQAMLQEQLRGFEERCECRFMEERIFLGQALREHEEQTEFRIKRALRMVGMPPQRPITFGVEPSMESVQVEEAAQDACHNPRPQYLPRWRTRSPCDKIRYSCMNVPHDSGVGAGLQ